jgi:hypothetical protein
MLRVKKVRINLVFFFPPRRVHSCPSRFDAGTKNAQREKCQQKGGGGPGKNKSVETVCMCGM